MNGFKAVNDKALAATLGKRGKIARIDYDAAAIAMVSGQIVAVETDSKEDAYRIRATAIESLKKRFPNGVKTRVAVINGKWTALFGAREAK
jgi:hypothetical protein